MSFPLKTSFLLAIFALLSRHDLLAQFIDGCQFEGDPCQRDDHCCSNLICSNTEGKTSDIVSPSMSNLIFRWQSLLVPRIAQKTFDARPIDCASVLQSQELSLCIWKSHSTVSVPPCLRGQNVEKLQSKSSG